MRVGIDFPLSRELSDPLRVAALAQEAEAAGWDGCFVWDHIQLRAGVPLADPWIVLSAIALKTNRMRLGTLVTPLLRRNPWKLAREAVSLDHLSNGRLILGIGLGSDLFGEITTFGGLRNYARRGQILDEGLAVLTGLWSGEPFSFSGQYYQVVNAHFTPRPLQIPRIPIWLAATWPKKAFFRRAALYEGVVPASGELTEPLSLGQFRELAEYINTINGKNFDIVRIVPDGTQDDLDAYEQAGVTWWVVSFNPFTGCFEQAQKRIVAGPRL